MRFVLLPVAVVLVVACVSQADEARLAMGDIPRTYNHYLNAQEAALCRANAATGGIEAYFLNPGCVATVTGVSGQATVRFGATSRSYLADAPDTYGVDESEFLVSQAVAAKTTDSWTLGFGYSSPAYRNLVLQRGMPGGLYRGEFSGSLRFFEVLFGSRIGTNGQGGIGIAAGLVGIGESADETLGGSSLGQASLDGTAASIAIGFVFDSTDDLTFGLGYRFGSKIDVSGEWYGEDDVTGTSETQPTAVGGLSYRLGTNYTLYASYIHEGWNKARASDKAAAYPDDGGKRNEFGDAIRTIALGAAGVVWDGRLTLRIGASKQLEDGLSQAIVPDYALGGGLTVHFVQYFVDAGFVREQFEVHGGSDDASTLGLCASVGYEF